ncbi:MAG: putative SAM-dependent methyltransferase [Candidatus Methanohalarchaeum thermophilum]|uniref:SAM-dependent methyltransferase n=1 Tax=Methanohalarchaeum thermophilum TaxID=1903181 RepID=A0A1Q6DVF3_METT1|nr:MAG: putative SAM-dependent methyltransferase [Candidatus Methanohalarchaeum thermophilum]
MINQLEKFKEYLRVKEEIDGFSFNSEVKKNFMSLVDGDKLKILEIGFGLGSMIKRCIKWGFSSEIEYWGIDKNGELIEPAKKNLVDFLTNYGLNYYINGDRIKVDDNVKVDVRFYQSELMDFRRNNYFNLLLANSFFDLVDIDKSIKKILSLSEKNAIFYFTINYDGITRFLPYVDIKLDNKIEKIYNGSMNDLNCRYDQSRSGSYLVDSLKKHKCEIKNLGPSDWVINPSFGENEKYFLLYILNLIQETVRSQDSFDERTEKWFSKRRQQIKKEELFFRACNLDMVGYLK